MNFISKNKGGNKKMHNQDTTKDDILEALFELSKMAKEFIENHIKEIKEEREKARIQAEALEAMKQLTGDKTEDLLDDPHRLFKAAMKHIEQNTDNEQIKNMAKLFHENPLDGIKLIDEVTNHQRQDQAFELSEASKEIIENLKKAQQLNNEKVTPDPQTEQLLSNLIEQEQGKLEMAATFLNHEIDLSKSPINSISSDDVKEIAEIFKGFMNEQDQKLESQSDLIKSKELELKLDVEREAQLLDEVLGEKISDNFYIKNYEIMNEKDKEKVELIKKDVLLTTNNNELNYVVELDLTEDGDIIASHLERENVIQTIDFYEFEDSKTIENEDKILFIKTTNKFEKESGNNISSEEIELMDSTKIINEWNEVMGGKEVQRNEKDLDQIIKEAIEKTKDQDKKIEKQRDMER